MVQIAGEGLPNPHQQSLAGCYGCTEVREMEGNNNTKEMSQKKYLKIAIPILFIYLFFMFFHVVTHNGKIMLMYTNDLFYIDRKGSSANNLFGRIMGSHTLKTEYGEIALKNWAEIEADNRPWVFGGIISIPAYSFTEGLATHNLAVDGNELPKNLEVAFFGTIGLFANNGIAGVYFYDDVEMNISDISITVSKIEFNYSRGDYKDYIYRSAICNRRYEGYLLPEITLADSTQIMKNIPEMHWYLFQFHDTDTWELYAYTRKIYSYEQNIGRQRNLERYFLVQHPGESELKGYVSITFGKDWGEFLEGVLIEEDDLVFRNE